MAFLEKRALANSVTFFAIKSTSLDSFKKSKENMIYIILSVMVTIKSQRTKQMEPILRAKVKIIFKSENLKKCF